MTIEFDLEQSLRGQLLTRRIRARLRSAGLNQMHDQMSEQGGMMEKMSGQTQSGCPMIGNTPPAVDKAPAK